MRHSRASSGKKEPHYEVSVWDWEGNVVRKLWDATEQELEALREEFADIIFTIVIDKEW